MAMEDGRGKDLTFFGAVTATATHELRNVLAIIAEHAGLAEDLLAPATAAPDHEKLRRMAERIGAQVKRGDEIVSRLNRFAHSSDKPRLEFELNDLIRDMLKFAERRADRRSVTLTHELPEKAVLMNGNRFQVQQAVFCAVDIVLENAPARASLRVTLAQGGSDISVSIAGPPPQLKGAQAEKWTRLCEVVDALGGSCTSNDAETRNQALVLRFPR